MTRAQVQFSELQFGSLRRISNETGKPVAELVRLAIDSMLRDQ
jgi:hypothetical protein